MHPALLKVASEGTAPKTVFIGGGGELATAREVLRHKSVEKVVMVDLDGELVDICKQYLPEWGGEAVLSDPRFQLIVGDAHAYMLETTDIFDVIIMDISDPIEAGPGIALYTKEFYEHAVTRLSKPHGVFVTQAGLAESIPSAFSDVSDVDPSCYAPIYNTLRSVFSCVVPYSTDIPSFGGDWGFILAYTLDDSATIVADASEEEWKIPKYGMIDELIEQQIGGGSDSLRYYDGFSHRRMFALTKPLRMYMQKDHRIMTKDNPIFMY